MATSERPLMESLVHDFYSQIVRPFVKDPLRQQRIKLVWFIWGYWPILRLTQCSFASRVRLAWRFLRIDWGVLHGHTPYQISCIAVAMDRQRNAGGNFVEAGCWNGGSSAKFSLLCALYGYRLHIYDSFEGVEDVSGVPGELDQFSGQYAATEATVLANLSRFGDRSSCIIYAGWFANTLAKGAPQRTRMAYIDCDIAKGTREH